MPTDPTPQINAQAASGPSSPRQLVFTSSQAAVYLGVSLATIRRWTDAGHIGCYRTPGGQRRFSRDQLDSFTASLRHGAHDEQAHTQRTVVGQPGRAVVA